MTETISEYLAAAVEYDPTDGRWVGAHFVKEQWSGEWKCGNCDTVKTRWLLFNAISCLGSTPHLDTAIHEGPAKWLCDAAGEHVCFEPEPRESILAEAERLINGDRQDAYSPPQHDFAATAELWTTYMNRRLESGHKLFQPEDVAMFMVLLKVSREAHKHGRDNLVDIAGYVGCAEMIHDSGR